MCSPPRYKPSRELSIFYAVFIALGVIGWIIAGLALRQGHFQPTGLIVSLYTGVGMVVGSVWSILDRKKWQVRQKQLERERESKEFFEQFKNTS